MTEPRYPGDQPATDPGRFAPETAEDKAAADSAPGRAAPTPGSQGPRRIPVQVDNPGHSHAAPFGVPGSDPVENSASASAGPAAAEPSASAPSPALRSAGGSASDGAGVYTGTPMSQPSPYAAPPIMESNAPVAAERRRSNAGTAAARKGPGWGAMIAAMAITALTTMAIILGLWGAQSPFSRSASYTDTGSAPTLSQSGAEVVEPVAPSTSGTANWEAVAAAVRPATVSIFVSGDNESASGSGVIIDGAGHVITNHHVVSGATQGGNITVTLHDGRLFSATIVGVDSTTDLAVLALETPPADLTAALLGDSANLKVGEPVMAIGAPLGLADTVTTGVISALDRPVAVSGFGQDGASDVVVTNAIQIDASINPGNSGGPLFNAEGAVIGINSSIASLGSESAEAGSIGLGFAIPIDLAKSVAAQILDTGSAQHAMLGVQISTGAIQVGTENRLGAVVASVNPSSAADQAGLAPGDVIVGIDGNSVSSGPSLTGYVRRYSVGDQVVLDVVRNGELQQIPVILQQR